jgi:hypothetical protein
MSKEIVYCRICKKYYELDFPENRHSISIPCPSNEDHKLFSLIPSGVVVPPNTPIVSVPPHTYPSFPGAIPVPLRVPIGKNFLKDEKL